MLAGALVLGVGGTMTLAAWTDQELASTTLQAGTFGIVGAANGTTFAEHPATAAPLTFAPSVGAMVPGSTSYSLFSIKTIAGSVAGTVQLTQATVASANAFSGALLVSLRTIPTTTSPATACTATTFASGTVVFTDLPANQVSGAAQSLAASGAAQVNYCVRVVLAPTAPNTAQGQSAALTWTFTGQTV